MARPSFTDETAPAVTIVVAAGSREAERATLAALARQRLDAPAEIVLVRRWRSGEPDPESVEVDWAPDAAMPLRVLADATAGAAAGANAGLAAARADAIVLLAAGDVPDDDDLLARHLEALSEADAVAGAARDAHGVSVGEAWVGGRPRAAPPTAGRHLSLRRVTAERADGLDDRLRDLDVAGVDLLARIAESGGKVAVRPDLAVAGAGDLERAGRSAQALDAVLQERPDRPRVEVGRPRVGVPLRWAALPLAAAAARAGADERLERLGRRARFARGRGRPWLPISPLDRIGLAPVARGAERPPVSVIVPFAGSAADAAELGRALAVIDRRPGDQLIVVDNSVEPAAAELPGIEVVRATGERSAYHARNAGAAVARNEWLWFTDADCRPAPWLLDALFSPPPAERTGAVAGAVIAAPKSGGWVEHYSEVADVLSQPRLLGDLELPSAVTASLLVRRAAFEAVGGFSEAIRSGGDREFCWRLRDAGWALEWRPRAVVEHAHRTSVAGLLRQYRRYGAGAGWLARRRADTAERWTVPSWRTGWAAALDLAAGRPEFALVRVTELACTTAAAVGRLGSNRPPAEPKATPATVAITAAWPVQAETARERLERLGANGPFAVEAARRGQRVAPAAPAAQIAYREDDAPLDLLGALAWLARRPGGLQALSNRGAGLRELAADAAVARRAERAQRLAAVDPADRDATRRIGHLLGIGCDE